MIEAHIFSHRIRRCVGSGRCGAPPSWPCAIFWRRAGAGARCSISITFHILRKRVRRKGLLHDALGVFAPAGSRPCCMGAWTVCSTVRCWIALLCLGLGVRSAEACWRCGCVAVATAPLESEDLVHPESAPSGALCDGGAQDAPAV